jgi:hypothetical protein
VAGVEVGDAWSNVATCHPDAATGVLEQLKDRL